MNSATTGGAFGIKDWVTILHNAAQVPPNSPRFEESRQVLQDAHGHLQALAGAANAADSAQATPNPGALAANAVAFGHGASYGIAGDPGYLAAAHANHPISTMLSDAAGTLASTTVLAAKGGLVGALERQGVGAGTTGALLGGAGGAVRGAVEPLPGFTRGQTAMLYAGVEGIGGAAVGKIVSKLLPIGVAAGQAVMKPLLKVAAQFGVKVGAKEAAALEEAAIREELTNMGAHPDWIERTLTARRTGKLPTDPPVRRAGETITPIAQDIPDPLAEPTYLRRGGRSMRPGQPVRPVPEPAPTNGGKQVANSYKELQSLLKQGVSEDQIKINYYTRGGKLQETVPPKPSSSPLANTNPFFKKSTDELRAMLTGPTAPSTPMEMRPKIRAEILRRGN